MEAKITELISITGRPREMCVQALSAAGGNADIACEILLSGGVPMEGGAEDDYGDEYEGEGSGAPGADMAGGNPLAALANNPSFAMIRQRIISDPNFYQQFMQ